MFEIYRRRIKEPHDQLIVDFHKYVDTDIPFYAIKEDVLFLMIKHNRTHFSIPAALTKRKQNDIYFCFEIEECKINISFKKDQKYYLYKYKGVQFNEPNKTI
ncbi:DUF5960 family protein [Enterococcus pallens]|uniref:Uncharacterized protein n=1 Tax=Enterococcus pallens ATCC BAA-351 TaxID=1158607 RepID=R2PSH7_9ENTE|nr:hypothetical protein UAU_05289 [Enterococcus pallens ATCC BAA-351]EOU09408.1 hypothetical protein I588_05254 [Enterococcus pallens ATCC BAA-351]